MSSPNLAPFAGQKYLNLESIKRDGTPVRTPVWFAEEEGVLYVYTLAYAVILVPVLPPVRCVAQ